MIIERVRLREIKAGGTIEIDMTIGLNDSKTRIINFGIKDEDGKVGEVVINFGGGAADIGIRFRGKNTEAGDITDHFKIAFKETREGVITGEKDIIGINFKFEDIRIERNKTATINITIGVGVAFIAIF
jgi:hypothetical protein